MLPRHALALLALTLVPSLEAQRNRDTAVVVHWASLHTDHRYGLRSGSDILLKVGELSALCYSTEVRVTQSGSRSATGQLVSMLNGQSPGPKPLFDEGAAPAAPGESKADTVQRELNQVKFLGVLQNAITASMMEVKAVKEPRDRIAKLAREIKKNVSDRIDRSLERIAQVDSTQAAAAKRQEDAAAALAKFYPEACPKDGHGEQGTDRDKLWQAAKAALELVVADAADLAKAGASLDTAATILNAALARIGSIQNSDDEDEIAYRNSEVGKSQLSRDKPLAETNQARIAGLKEKLAVLSKTRREQAATLAGIERLISQPDTRLFPVAVRNDTDQLEVTIAATGRPEIPTVKDTKYEDKVTLPVLRRRRYFETVGPAITIGGSFPRYALVNQRDPSDSTKTRSAYADRNGGKLYAIAPTVFGHMSLQDSESEVALLGTLGIGMRSTAGGLRPDFFGGLSLGFGDRLVATLGLAVGWREQLIDEGLTTGPVPSIITPESAIRTQVKPGFFVGLSFRP